MLGRLFQQPSGILAWRNIAQPFNCHFQVDIRCTLCAGILVYVYICCIFNLYFCCSRNSYLYLRNIQCTLPLVGLPLAYDIHILGSFSSSTSFVLGSPQCPILSSSPILLPIPNQGQVAYAVALSDCTYLFRTRCVLCWCCVFSSLPHSDYHAGMSCPGVCYHHE